MKTQLYKYFVFGISNGYKKKELKVRLYQKHVQLQYMRHFKLMSTYPILPGSELEKKVLQRLEEVKKAKKAKKTKI